MRKVISAINMTIDGFCDHTYGIADEELHYHYAELLKEAGVLLYGRKTYELMTFWQGLLDKPSGDKSMDDFAKAIDGVPKIVFSGTLKSLDWPSARLSEHSFVEEIMNLKMQPGKDIFIGSPSLISEATRMGLVHELQLCVHPVIAGKGLRLFKDVSEQIFLNLKKTKTLGSGAMVHYYAPKNNP